MDREAPFKQMLVEHQDRIYRSCCCYVGDPEERSDVCQDVLLQLRRSPESYAGRSSLSTWFYRVAVNGLIDRLKALEAQQAKALRSARLLWLTSDVCARILSARNRIPQQTSRTLDSCLHVS